MSNLEKLKNEFYLSVSVLKALNGVKGRELEVKCADELQCRYTTLKIDSTNLGKERAQAEQKLRKAYDRRITRLATKADEDAADILKKWRAKVVDAIKAERLKARKKK